MSTRQKSKKVINANIPNSKVEGLQVKTFSARLSDKHHQKLGEIMDKLGVTGNTESDRFRSFIDILHDYHIRHKGETAKLEITRTPSALYITCPKDKTQRLINRCLDCNDPKFSNCKEAVKKYMEA